MKKMSLNQMEKIEGGQILSKRAACIGAGAVTTIVGTAMVLTGVGALFGMGTMIAGTLGIMSC